MQLASVSSIASNAAVVRAAVGDLWTLLKAAKDRVRRTAAPSGR
jgi:hypothetical protein